MKTLRPLSFGQLSTLLVLMLLAVPGCKGWGRSDGYEASASTLVNRLRPTVARAPLADAPPERDFPATNTYAQLETLLLCQRLVVPARPIRRVPARHRLQDLARAPPIPV